MTALLVITLSLAALAEDGGVVPDAYVPTNTTGPIVAPGPVDAGVEAHPAQTLSGTTAPFPTPPPTPLATTVDAGISEPPSKLTLRGAIEADLGLFPSGFGENGVDLLSAVHPLIAFGVGDDFLIELGPTIRFRLADFAPDNRTSDIGGFLRGADWDELSDYGQILQTLRIGHATGPFHLRVGPARKKTLGLGHVLWRYDTQLNPNYHPASAELGVHVGPIRAELFASDVLGARLFGGEASWDIGGTFTSDAAVKDRYGLSFALVHDFNLAGLPFRPTPELERVTPTEATVMHVTGTAVLIRNATLRWMLLGGLGTRATLKADLGLVFGMTVDATLKDLGFSTRIELRKQAGGFRHGFFGPAYELQRFADVGFRGASVQDALLPDSASVFGEVRFAVGTRVTFDAAAEYFFWNRLDLDGGLSLELVEGWFFATLRSTVLGVGPAPRFSVTGGLRWRLFPSVYVLGEGGTVFFPQPDGSLVRGVHGSLGIGFDFER